MLRIRVVLVFVLVLFFTSCAMTGEWQPPQEMYNEDGSLKKSLILDYVDYPRETALLIRLTSYELVERAEVISPQEYEDYIRWLMDYVENPEITYFELYKEVQEKIHFLNSEVDGEIFIMSGVLVDIGTRKITILEGDKILLQMHLQDHLETALYMQRTN